MRSKQWFGIAAIAVFACGMGGCMQRTNFEGEAKFPGGARGCYDKCREIGMSMASYVFVGEYSTGCVCEPLRAPGPQPTPAAQRGSESSSVAAAAGVVMQMRADEDAQRQNSYYRTY
jgi:hypothetical protein